MNDISAIVMEDISAGEARILSQEHVHVSLEKPARGLRGIFFLRREETPGQSGEADSALPEAVRGEMVRAVGVLRAEGFVSGILSGKAVDRLLSGLDAETSHTEMTDTDLPNARISDVILPNPETTKEKIPHNHLGLQNSPDPRCCLFLCDDGGLLRQVREAGLAAVGYLHGANAGVSFPGAAYVVQEPDLVDADSYVKMYQREAGQPWDILQTGRCGVREFTRQDMKSILTLYDAQARRFLTPPSEDLRHESDILQAYIDRIYPLYGFGHWAVTARGDFADSGIKQGGLVGRIGFSMLTGEQEREALALGLRADDAAGNRGSGIDADFGFLVHPACRGKGIAMEVCGALLRYGFETLDFRRIRADAHRDNRASLALLEKLGFTRIGTAGERVVFCLDRARETISLRR